MEITSVSWIDKSNLPPVKVGMMWEALKGGGKGWDDRATIGLIATTNPSPPALLGSVEIFQKGKQYRALTSIKLQEGKDGFVGEPILDPGWTPPFDKKKLPTLAGLKPTPEEATKFHRGELSAISSASFGKKLFMSSLDVHPLANVLAHVFIKFRAGEVTNKLGIEEAHSPYHVPWVCCETMLVKGSTGLFLYGRGSAFPSHVWYVNGERRMSTIQSPVSAKPNDPVLSTGRPISEPRLNHNLDRSEGPIQSHAYSVMPGKQVETICSFP